MRVLSVFRKSLREQTRDLGVLLLTLAFAPFFVFLYSLFFPNGSTSYGVLLINLDAGVTRADGSRFEAGAEVGEAIAAMAYPNGNPLLKVTPVADRAAAERTLRDRGALVLLILPEDFSRTVEAARGGDGSAHTAVTFAGDLTNPYYPVAAVIVTTVVDTYVRETTGAEPPVGFVEEPLGGSAARSEFETYVPGILVFAVILLIFMAAMMVTREVEAGTLRRLQLTRMTAFDLLGGITGSLVVTGVVAVLLTFAAAVGLGFHSQGPLWLAVLIGAVTSVSIIGVGLIVACFSKTVAQAFVIANLPLGLFMFFSGAIFPIPRVPLFEVGGRTVGLYDILPPTHAVVALNKVLTLGAALPDVLYELGALVVLSALYFVLGVWLFSRIRLTAE